MNKINFLKKLRKEEKLELVESSEEMRLSYLQKSENCLKSASILFENSLYENSIAEAYYCMYNSLLSLLFRVGIKSENHSGSIILLDKLFSEPDLIKLILFAKEERIDKQYYVESQQNIIVTKESCEDMILKSEDFSLRIRVMIESLNNEKISLLRNLFREFFESE